jgi:hypothetical protein
MTKCKSCNKQANFGKPGTKKAEYCKDHSPSDYVNIVSKTCIHPNCTTIPSYGKPGTKKAEYCKDHSPSNYVDVKNKTCIHPNCTIQPSYGKPGTKKAEYCKDHSPSYYLDVIHKTCIHPNCTIQPSYGKPGTKKAEYCKDHSPSDYIDVIHKTCIHLNCTTRPSYGYSGYPPEYCATHKLPRMVIYPKNKPKEEEKNCTYCNSVIHYNEEYCSSCKTYLDLGQTVRSHEKELRLKTILDDMEVKYIHDTIVTGGCSRKRPDYQIPTQWGTIILEVDEEQHKRKNYSCECETTRMRQIFYDIGTEYTVFIRYNPDRYKPTQGKQWALPKREEYLKKYIQECIETQPETNLGVVYLFYDGFVCPPEIENIEVL